MIIFFGTIFGVAVPVGVALLYLGLKEPDKIRSRVEVFGAILCWPRLLWLSLSELEGAFVGSRLRAVAPHAWSVPLYWAVVGYFSVLLLTGGELWLELQASVLLFATIFWLLIVMVVLKVIDFFVIH